MEKIDCACVIHGDTYDWRYVENLYHMLERNFTASVDLHVFTEPQRLVPSGLIKHDLELWTGVSGPKKSWWYKMQMFDPRHGIPRILYLDLDVVITGNLDWMLDLDPQWFWTILDFKYLWRPAWTGFNSSVMFWETQKFASLWHKFSEDIAHNMRFFHGDQDFLNHQMPPDCCRFIDRRSVKSWRWEIKDGGMDFRTRAYKRPGAGAGIDPWTKIIVFHGRPKPHEINDPLILQHWQ